MSPRIKGFIRHSLLDWEGYISSVVFLAGCNFRCPYCHAAHLVLGDPGLERIPLEAVLAYLRDHRDWIDGVVLSGGEPTLYPALPDMIDTFRDLNLKVKLDTNGSQPVALGDLIRSDRLDYIAMDVKAPLDERYHVAAGVKVDLRAVRRSLDLVMRSGIDYELRTTVCAKLHSEQDILDMAAQLSGARRWILQPFRPLNCIDKSFGQMAAESPERLAELARLASGSLATVAVRGETG